MYALYFDYCFCRKQDRKESGRRSTIQLTRKLLEHSDLVMYMKENQRPVNLMDAEDYHLANVLEFPERKAVRRRRSKNNKHLSNKEKKKKKKNAHKVHPEHRKTQKKRAHGATGHAVAYNWAANKEDKDTLTDHVEWNDEAVCSCSDGDIGSAIKCSICNRFYQTSSDISNKYVSSLGVQKSKDKEKKKRFSFLQKSFQDKKKEKNLENRDWKKADEKSILKKHEKFPSTSQGDQQCACCKCDLHIRDKMIREKKENKRKVLQKLKAKKRKEKKRRKDEIRKSEKCANVCFKDNCK
ncbi:uncharacterized protein LOC143221160 isoform X2 [Lasioglossum baleicum]|uniref:uncharacterized protein LOC143221160 isoform X2 n=1 Tax=Lasioglossum baleicum TaxID=434251 RepID=UPI003FCCA01D